MTANTPNRDAKGKFMKAAKRFAIGDSVSGVSNIGRRFTDGIVSHDDGGKLNRQPYRVKFTNDGRPDEHWCSHKDLSLSTAPAELQPSPAPCPFKVGDRVERVAIRPIDHGNIRHGSSGTVTECQPNSVTVRWDMGQGYRDYTDRYFAYIRKVEDAPAKEPEQGPYRMELANALKAYCDANTLDAGRTLLALYDCTNISNVITLSCVTRRAFMRECLQRDTKAVLAERDSLRVELTKAKRDAAATQSDWEGAHQLLDGANVAMGTPGMGVHLLERIEALIADRDRERNLREAQTIQLTDLAAIVKCMELAKASPIEDWDFATLTRDVLNRGEAA